MPARNARNGESEKSQKERVRGFEGSRIRVIKNKRPRAKGQSKKKSLLGSLSSLCSLGYFNKIFNSTNSRNSMNSKICIPVCTEMIRQTGERSAG